MMPRGSTLLLPVNPVFIWFSLLVAFLLNLLPWGRWAGMPDLLIFDPPPLRPDCFATALEMKREDARPSDLREDQLRWLTILGDRGWAAVVGLGANDALTKLRQLGYAV